MSRNTSDSHGDHLARFIDRQVEGGRFGRYIFRGLIPHT
ncbi:hypothetical protein FV228_11520 [Methylobacterium sp. WL18]|nr:type II toxin-antitoxin system ParD family antitoxin [Methylobacterium sp. WL18]TXN71223.1 hypothetical protein FV228_11520 [Methylobacterium sp. WL18]